MNQNPTETHDSGLAGRDHLSLKAFAGCLSGDDQALDHGLSRFVRALESGLPVYDQADQRLTDSQIKQLIEQCHQADEAHARQFNAQFDAEFAADGPTLRPDDTEFPSCRSGKPSVGTGQRLGHQVSMRHRGETNEDFERRLWAELAQGDGGTWAEYLPEATQRHRIRRDDYSQICHAMGMTAFPWIDGQAKPVKLLALPENESAKQDFFCDGYLTDFCRWLEKTCTTKDIAEQTIWQSHFARLNRLSSEGYGASVLQRFEDHLQSELKASQKRGDIQGYRVAEILLDALRKLAESSQWGGPVLRFLDEIALSKTGAKPVSSSVKAERDCERWLCDLMQEPQPAGKAKSAYQDEARKKFSKLSIHGFRRAWSEALSKSQHGASWSKAGRKS